MTDDSSTDDVNPATDEWMAGWWHDVPALRSPWDRRFSMMRARIDQERARADAAHKRIAELEGAGNALAKAAYEATDFLDSPLQDAIEEWELLDHD